MAERTQRIALPVEGREEPVAGVLDLAAAVALEIAAHDGVMRLEQVAL